MSRVPRAFTIDDLRRHARRRLPRAVYDFIEGGAGDERTVARNRTAFEKLLFEPRVLVDVSKREQSTVVLGERVATPVILSPTGMAGLSWPKGEVAAARGAHEAGTIYTLSTHSSCSIEEVAAGAPGPLWFQLYVWQNRDLTRSFVERARAAGYKALLLTVDVPVVSRRERDLRNGFTIPPRVTARNVVDTLRRARWVRRVLMGQPRLTLANLVGAPGAPRTDIVTLAGVANRQVDPSISWADLAWFRSLWSGPLLLKGVMTAADARRAVEHGVDGLVVSNHGGRQLDGAVAPLRVLPGIAAQAGGMTVMMDSGVRRGTDVLKALALGAQFVFLGRPFFYAAAIAGEPGVRHAVSLLQSEIDRDMALLGIKTLAEMRRELLTTARGAEFLER
jgi:L-lactate dehydrogenase (cytochrome)